MATPESRTQYRPPRTGRESGDKTGGGRLERIGLATEAVHSREDWKPECRASAGETAGTKTTGIFQLGTIATAGCLWYERSGTPMVDTTNNIEMADKGKRPVSDRKDGPRVE